MKKILFSLIALMLISSASASMLSPAFNDGDKAVTIARQLADAYLDGDLQAMIEVIENPIDNFNGNTSTGDTDHGNANWLRILAGMLPAMAVLTCMGIGRQPGKQPLFSIMQ